MRLSRLFIISAIISVFASMSFAAVAAAQTPAQDAAAGPHVELTPVQRQTIFQSVSATQKNHAAPIGFRVSVGATVPSAITLAPLPDTLRDIAPQASGYEVAMIEKQVVLVDPQTRHVAAVIRGGEP